MATDTMTLFRQMLGHLKEVSDGLKAVEREGLPRSVGNGHKPGGSNAEAAKIAAWNVAALATEVARDAVQLCHRLDPNGGPPRTGRRWWFSRRRM
jgi:hypothetical protein